MRPLRTRSDDLANYLWSASLTCQTIAHRWQGGTAFLLGRGLNYFSEWLADLHHWCREALYHRLANIRSEVLLLGAQCPGYHFRPRPQDLSFGCGLAIHTRQKMLGATGLPRPTLRLSGQRVHIGTCEVGTDPKRYPPCASACRNLGHRGKTPGKEEAAHPSTHTAPRLPCGCWCACLCELIPLTGPVHTRGLAI